MKLLFNQFQTLVKRNSFEFSIVAVSILYFYFCLTPSSYGYILDLFDLPNNGLFFGSPKSIRSDEFYVLTPYFQIAVNNNFSETNSLSPYQETLKSFYSLPIFNWSLLFKPQLWMFFLIPPEYALSFYYAFLNALFLIGYYRYLKALNFSNLYSIFGSLLLFSSRFVQVWHTTNIPTFAWLPLPFLIILSVKVNKLVKSLLLYYTAVALILSYTYPPFIISGAFSLLIFSLSSLDKDKYKYIISFAPLAFLASILALLTCYIYYFDVIGIASNTVYPGLRQSSGGGVSFWVLASHVFPFISALNFLPPSDIGNECSIGSVSSFLPLLVICYSRFSQLKGAFLQNKRFFIISIVPMLAMIAWMTLPIPSYLGKFLLWDKVPASRMLWGFGLLWSFFWLKLFSLLDLKISMSRNLIILHLISISILFKYIYLSPRYENLLYEIRFSNYYFDIVAILILYLLITIEVYPNLLKYIPYYSYTLSTSKNLDLVNRPLKNLKIISIFLIFLINALTFMTFNPLQSSKSIFKFDINDSTILSSFQDLQKYSNQPLAVDGNYGATLGGLGIPSLNHVLLLPQLDFFNRKYFYLDSDIFNHLFNRYSHISFSDLIETPQLLQDDHISLPIWDFSTFPVINLNSPKTTYDTVFNSQIFSGGYIDQIFIVKESNSVILKGWSRFEGINESQYVYLNLNNSLVENYSAEAYRYYRSDVSQALNNTSMMLSGLSVKIMIPIGILDLNSVTDIAGWTDKFLHTLNLFTYDPILSYTQIPTTISGYDLIVK